MKAFPKNQSFYATIIT